MVEATASLLAKPSPPIVSQGYIALRYVPLNAQLRGTGSTSSVYFAGQPLSAGGYLVASLDKGTGSPGRI
jgi:hypothetical protein